MQPIVGRKVSIASIRPLLYGPCVKTGNRIPATKSHRVPKRPFSDRVLNRAETIGAPKGGCFDQVIFRTFISWFPWFSWLLEILEFIVLRECRPSKEVPKPRPEKVPKGVLRKVTAPNGVLRKVPKNCFGVPSPVLFFTEARTRSTFSALPSAPRLGPALTEALLSALFLVGTLTLL